MWHRPATSRNIQDASCRLGSCLSSTAPGGVSGSFCLGPPPCPPLCSPAWLGLGVMTTILSKRPLPRAAKRPGPGLPRAPPLASAVLLCETSQAESATACTSLLWTNDVGTRTRVASGCGHHQFSGCLSTSVAAAAEAREAQECHFQRRHSFLSVPVGALDSAAGGAGRAEGTERAAGAILRPGSVSPEPRVHSTILEDGSTEPSWACSRSRVSRLR